MATILAALWRVTCRFFAVRAAAAAAAAAAPDDDDPGSSVERSTTDAGARASAARASTSQPSLDDPNGSLLYCSYENRSSQPSGGISA